jgi:glutamate synthase domain-containing protein 1
MDNGWAKEISGCGLAGLISRKGNKVSGEVMIQAIANMRERGNGLGGGFAGYGIYPDYPDHYALHTMYYSGPAQDAAEDFVRGHFRVDHAEVIPTRTLDSVTDVPLLWRYFVRPRQALGEEGSADVVMRTVMHVNDNIKDAYIFSSGQNMGAFKAVGFAENIGRFYCLEEYEGHIWTAHARFPTNTQAWWGRGAPLLPARLLGDPQR